MGFVFKSTGRLCAENWTTVRAEKRKRKLTVMQIVARKHDSDPDDSVDLTVLEFAADQGPDQVGADAEFKKMVAANPLEAYLR